MKNNKTGIYNQLYNTIWIYKIGKNSYSNGLTFGENGGMFTIRLTKNHTIDTLSYTDNKTNNSGYHLWKIDAINNQVVMMDKNRNTKARTSLPHQLSDQMSVMDVVGTNDQFITFKEISQFQVSSPTLGGKNMAFLQNKNLNDKDKHTFQQNDFNVHLFFSEKTPLNFLLDTYSYLITHHHLKKIILLNNNQLVSILKFDQTVPSDKVLLLTNKDNVHKLSSELLIGSRSIILEFLSALFMEINHYQLSHDNFLPYLDDTFNFTAEKYFKNRIVIL